MGGPLNYREVSPGPALARYVQCYWFLSSAERETGEVQPILPDGRMELVLNLGNHFRRVIESGWERQPPVMVVGQMGGPVVVEPTGAVDIVGVRFHPWGAGAFIDAPMAQFRDQLSSLDDVSGKLYRLIKDNQSELLERRSIASLERVLQSALRVQRNSNDLAERAARLIVSSRGATSVSAIASEVGLTGRQLERRFVAAVGIGPKRLCRLLRFQEALRVAQEQSRPNWAEIAARSGYFDQAHLIRDFSEFSGASPAALQLSETSLTALMVAESNGR